MAKPKYRLEVLLRMKARAKRRAEILLAKAIAELVRAKEKLKKLEEEKKVIVEKWKAARKEMRQKMAFGGLVGVGKVHVNFLRKLKEDEEQKEAEIEDQKQVILDCIDEVARARRAYIDAAKEHKIMEKHRELWAKKIRDELTKKEEREMDELGTTIHELKRWRGEKPIFESK